VLGRKLLPFRELETVVIEIEGALNRRPLTIVSDELDDGPPLTPFHFMDGTPPSSLDMEVPDFSDAPFLIPAWRKRREILRRWWKEWRAMYLKSLHEWHSVPSSSARLPKVGDVVLVEEDGVSRVKWPLGRIQELILGKDGHPRAAVVKRGRFVITRPTKKLYFLESSESTLSPTDSPSDSKTHDADDESGKKQNPSTVTRSGRVVRPPVR
jgi:hypothetical protein